uniref:Anoctamin transmembrane domain-containing protein n=1 Tax=Bicosoecida sp. CB-2014 TaxID=1486930 RepID=A0A7S1CFR8_9STRA
MEADDEHVRHSSLCSSLDEIKKEYGRGVFVYFHMLRFVGLGNLVMGLIALAAFLGADSEGIVDDGVATMFLSSYPAASHGAWAATSVLMLLAGIAIGPGYRRYQAFLSKKWTGADREEEIERDDAIIEYDKNGARITISSSSRRCRKYVSVFVFVLVLVAQGVLQWLLHVALADASDNTTAQIIAVVITVLNIVWKTIGKKLTIFEKHETWTSYREWDTGKVFLLKLFNLVILYIVKTVTAQSGNNADECPLKALGYQFFWLIVYDLTLNNMVELAAPLAMTFVYKKLGWTKGKGDNASKPRFDLAEEYVEVLYRQFVVFLGMLVFPLLAMVSAFAFVLEHWLDKARLLYICQKPTKREEPLRGKLVMWLYGLTCLAALASFPNGAAWVLGGYNMEHCGFFM